MAGMNRGLLAHPGSDAELGLTDSIRTQRFAKSNAAWDAKQRRLETLALGVNNKQRPMVTVGYELWRSPCKLWKARHWDDNKGDNSKSTSLAGLLEHRKRVLLTGFPGCFVGNCSRHHIPAYHRELEALKKAGIEMVICVSVNDPYTQQGWLDSLKLPESSAIGVYSDPDGDLVTEIGMDVRLNEKSLGGVRCRTFALVLANGVVEHIFVEDSPDDFEKTKPANIISVLTLNPLAPYMQGQHHAHVEVRGEDIPPQATSLSVG